MNTPQIIRELGGPVSIGKHLGIRSQAVSQWVIHERIPLERVAHLEMLARKIGSRIRAEDMRPDIPWQVFRQAR